MNAGYDKGSPRDLDPFFVPEALGTPLTFGKREGSRLFSRGKVPVHPKFGRHLSDAQRALNNFCARWSHLRSIALFACSGYRTAGGLSHPVQDLTYEFHTPSLRLERARGHGPIGGSEPRTRTALKDYA